MMMMSVLPKLFYKFKGNKKKSSVIVFRKLIKRLLMLTYNNNGLYIVMSVLKKENQG